MLAYITHYWEYTNKKGIDSVGVEMVLVETGNVKTAFFTKEKFLEFELKTIKTLDLTKVGGEAYDVDFDQMGNPQRLTEV